MRHTFTLLIVILFPLLGVTQTRTKGKAKAPDLAFTHVTVLDMADG
jgi:hypothetical protein